MLQGKTAAIPTWREHVKFMKRHFEAMTVHYGESIGTLLFRRWIPQYSRGLKLGKDLMVSLLQISQAAELRQRFDEIEQQNCHAEPRVKNDPPPLFSGF